MNNMNYTICKADRERTAHVFKHSAIKNEEERRNANIYIAIDDNNSIIGRIIVVEQNVPAPIMGKCWYIADIFVHPEHRRNGIATALFEEIKRQAELSNITYFWGHARPSLEASMFWLNQGVTMHPSGTMQNDTSKPLWFGNYLHIFSYCVRRKVLCGVSCGVHIRKIAKDEMADLINKYTEDESKKNHYLSKANDLFGFVAVSQSNETIGAILAFPHSMKAPLDSTYWVTNICVDPHFRHQGIGKSLIWRLYQYAQEKDAIQLTSFATGDHIGFWYKLGFDIYFRGKNNKGDTLAAAMIRVK